MSILQTSELVVLSGWIGSFPPAVGSIFSLPNWDFRNRAKLGLVACVVLVDLLVACVTVKSVVTLAYDLVRNWNVFLFVSTSIFSE